MRTVRSGRSGRKSTGAFLMSASSSIHELNVMRLHSQSKNGSLLVFRRQEEGIEGAQSCVNTMPDPRSYNQAKCRLEYQNFPSEGLMEDLKICVSGPRVAGALVFIFWSRVVCCVYDFYYEYHPSINLRQKCPQYTSSFFILVIFSLQFLEQESV